MLAGRVIYLEQLQANIESVVQCTCSSLVLYTYIQATAKMKAAKRHPVICKHLQYNI